VSITTRTAIGILEA